MSIDRFSVSFSTQSIVIYIILHLAELFLLIHIEA